MTAALVVLFLSAQVTNTAAAVSGYGVQGGYVSVDNLDELMAWYKLGDQPDSSLLSKDIVINKPITLSNAPTNKTIDTGTHTIRVVAGGILTVNDSKVYLRGPDVLITVEAGGKLQLNSGAVDGDRTKNVVVIKKGGSIKTVAGFHIDGKTYDENELPELPTTAPTEGIPDTTLPEEEGFYPITGIAGSSYSAVCQEGEMPKVTSYPSTVSFNYQIKEEQYASIELPVTWDLDRVKNKKAGVYQVEGVVSNEVLKEHSLKNPGNYKGSLYVTVLKPGPLTDIRANLLSVNSSKKASVQFVLPVLPPEVTAINIYKSSDNVQWERLYWEDTDAQGKWVERDNFLGCLSTSSPSKNYVKASYTTNYRPAWLRIELEGSIISGMTNTVKVNIPSSARPGMNNNYGSDSDDSGFDGNLGSGGQGNSDQLKETESSAGETKESSEGEGGETSKGGGRRSRPGSDSYSVPIWNGKGDIVVYAGGQPFPESDAPNNRPGDAGTGEQAIGESSMSADEDVLEAEAADDTADAADGQEVGQENLDGTISGENDETTGISHGIRDFSILACGVTAAIMIGVYIIYRRKRSKKES